MTHPHEHALEFEMSPEELLSFAVLNLRRSPAYSNAKTLRAVLLAIAALLAALAWYWISHSHPISGGFAAAFAVLCLWVTYTVSEFGFVRAQRAIGKHVAPFAERFEFSTDGITDVWSNAAEYGDNGPVPPHHEWTKIVELRENELVLALYLTLPGDKEDKALVIPKRVVDAAFKGKIEQQTGKTFALAP